jgi:hypothetical protein
MEPPPLLRDAAQLAADPLGGSFVVQPHVAGNANMGYATAPNHVLDSVDGNAV